MRTSLPAGLVEHLILCLGLNCYFTLTEALYCGAGGLCLPAAPGKAFLLQRDTCENPKP
jgi:hypothetical protein